MSAAAGAAAPEQAAPPTYGFPGHSVAASPVLSLWRQVRERGGAGRATPAGAAVSPWAALRLSPLPRDGASRQRVHFQRFVFLTCSSLGVAVFALAIAAQQLQDPVDQAAYVARCSALYPQYALRHAALNASAPFPPPRPPHPPRSPRPPPPLTAPPPPPAKPLELYPGYSDFERGGAQLCFASLIVGIGAFLIPLVCGSCCACDGRRCCGCTGTRALAALLCQALGWFGFGVFVANMSQAAAWQASITCGCTPGRAGVAVPAAGLLSASGAFGSSSSDSSSSSSSDYGMSDGCGGKPPAVLADLYVTIFGALGMFACAMALAYFYLSSLQAAMAARDAALRLNPLLPTARRQLPPIIVAEPWGAPRGGRDGQGGGEGGGVVEMMQSGRMVVVEEPGGTVCVGTTEPVQPPPTGQQQQLAQAPAGAAQPNAVVGSDAPPQLLPLPRGFRRMRPPPEPPTGV